MIAPALLDELAALDDDLAEVHRAANAAQERQQRIRELIRAALDPGRSGETAAAAPTWPPDPATIDLNETDETGRRVWLSPSEAAYEHHCSEYTVRRWCRERGCGVQIGGRWWVHRIRLAGTLAGI
jgi:hypothetical protein